MDGISPTWNWRPGSNGYYGPPPFYPIPMPVPMPMSPLWYQQQAQAAQIAMATALVNAANASKYFKKFLYLSSLISFYFLIFF